MGEIKVKIELENFGDRYMFLEKKIKENEIRQYKMDAIVDTGAVMLTLPQDVVEELGLKILRTVLVIYKESGLNTPPVRVGMKALVPKAREIE